MCGVKQMGEHVTTFTLDKGVKLIIIITTILIHTRT